MRRSRYGWHVFIVTSKDTSSINFKISSFRDVDRKRRSVSTGRRGIDLMMVLSSFFSAAIIVSSNSIDFPNGPANKIIQLVKYQMFSFSNAVFNEMILNVMFVNLISNHTLLSLDVNCEGQEANPELHQ